MHILITVTVSSVDPTTDAKSSCQVQLSLFGLISPQWRLTVAMPVIEPP